MTTVRSGEARASDAGGKLVSWKAIAEYFECEVRTAKRWEHERGLPIHRAPGGKRGYVFAYTWELDEWLRTRQAGSREAGAGDESLAVPPVSVDATASHAEAWNQASEQTSTKKILTRWPAWGLAGASVLLAVSLTLWMLASRHAAGAKLSVSPVSRPVPAPEAEKLYLRGRYFWNLRTPESLSKAVDAYTQAIVEDPSYAEPYAGLAEAYELMPQFAHADLGEAFARARSAADRAIQLNPNLVAAHRAKAFVLFYWDWDIAGSDEEFKLALGLDPNSAETHHWYASTLFSRLEGPECLQQIEEARRLSPGSAAIAADAAYFRASFDDLGAGMRALREIEQTQPTLASPAQFLSELDFATGNFPAYIEDLHKYAAITRNGDDAALADAVERGWARSGKEGLLEARALALKTGFGHGTERGFVLGETLLLLGRSQEALPYFKAAIVNHHDIGLAVIRQDPSARKLLDGPGYRQLFGEVDERLRRGDLASPAVLPVSFRLPF